ncbi:MAG: arginine--tRNA ligase [Xenococcaceae cyanobacterium MO_188.B29]|nr:arginine--tRNA ligase [Xenococcaceae cyanobacterium MO_188.B29]
MQSLLEQLKKSVSEALVSAFGTELTSSAPLVVPASNPKFGDYQSNVALSLPKKLKIAPRSIAEKIVENLKVDNFCETPTIAGPGFINFTIKPTYLATQLTTIQTDNRLGIEPVRSPQRIIVDYPSPNVAKEMHVGHLRSAIIGDCLARILEFVGHDVLRISHIGDWGTPFGMLIAYLKEAYPEALTTTEELNLGELSTFYRQAKKRFDEDENFREAARLSVVQLQAGDRETLLAWKIVCELSSRSYQKIYDLMGLSPEIEARGESFYNPFLPEIVTELEKLGLLEESDGAKCVFLEDFTNREGEPLPLIVQKSDGGYNYATTDLAAIRYRVNVDKVQQVIYPVGSEQRSHFAQIFQVGKRAGWITENHQFIHAYFGLVLGEDGTKLKTRSGEAIKLKELLDKAITLARKDLETRLQQEEREETEEFIDRVSQVVGISAVKYADLSQNRTSDYKFSYQKMLALQGNTAPYLLYAYVRVQGISRKGNIDFTKLTTDTQILLQEATEITLAKHILQLGEVITEVEKDLLPNRLCQYLFELSQKFNQFYDRCPILQADEPSRTSRLVLADLTARTIKLGLSLLGISVIERM